MEENTVEIVKEEPKRELSEVMFAWVSLIAGILLCKLFPVTEKPFAGMLFTVTLYIVGMIVLSHGGAKIRGWHLAVAISAILLQFSMILTSNGLIHFLSYVYALETFMYFIYSSYGRNIEGGYSEFILSDYIKATLLMPFSSFGFGMFKSLSIKRGRTAKSIIGKVLLGIALAIIPTGAVLGLLAYDADFWNIVHNIFDYDWNEITSWISSIIFGVPVGMYIYGAYVSAREDKCSNKMTAESGRKTSASIKFVPVLTASIAIIPVLLVYVVFFISQWKYYVAAFGGALPENMIYSEYAREGFFQLCLVNFINFVIIGVASAFTKRTDGKPSGMMKVLSVITSVFTLVLISTAMSKMILYIDAYGLTPLRVYTSLIMILMMIVFILLIVKQFVQKFKFIPAALSVTVVMFMFIGLFGVDGYIARFNVDRYINGGSNSVDVDTISELGVDGYEQLAVLADYYTQKYGVGFAYFYNHPNSREQYEDKEFYSDYIKLCYSIYGAENDITSEDGVWTFSIPKERAKRAFEEHGFGFVKE